MNIYSVYIHIHCNLYIQFFRVDVHTIRTLVSRVYTPFWSVYRDISCITLLASVYTSLLSVYRALLSVYRALMCILYMHLLRGYVPLFQVYIGIYTVHTLLASVHTHDLNVYMCVHIYSMYGSLECI